MKYIKILPKPRLLLDYSCGSLVTNQFTSTINVPRQYRKLNLQNIGRIKVTSNRAHCKEEQLIARDPNLIVYSFYPLPFKM